MNSEQLEIFTQKQKEVIEMLDRIVTIDIPNHWVKAFSSLVLARGFVRLTDAHLQQMRNIAATDSEAVHLLATLNSKPAGLSTLEVLSLDVPDENTRAKAVELIVLNGIKNSRRDLDVILSAAKHTRSLFDEVRDE